MTSSSPKNWQKSALKQFKVLKEKMAAATQGPFLAISQIAENLMDFGSVDAGRTDAFDPNSLTFCIADRAAHYKLVHQTMCDIFAHQEPITRAVGATSSDVDKFYHDICEECFDSPFSVIAFDGDRLVGFVLSFITSSNTFAVSVNTPEKHGSSLKADYSEDIENGPYFNRPANQLVVYINEVEKNSEQFMPRCKKYLKLDILFVHPNYTGHGIATKLVEKTLQMARDNHCQYVITCATARASAHIFNKSGFRCVREIPFNSFCENGVPVYQNLHDGNTSSKLMVLKLGSSLSSATSSFEAISLNSN